MQRPAPAPSAENRPFWEGAARGILQLAECEVCGRIAYPPKPRCPYCLSGALRWTELSGRARLRGWTDNHLAALPGYERPICIVECALEEDPGAVVVALDPVGAVRYCRPDAQLQIGFVADVNGWSYPQVVSVEDVS
ncbi:Zn-ribbon domain-containing OB-fold protein [Rhizobium binxianense]